MLSSLLISGLLLAVLCFVIIPIAFRRVVPTNVVHIVQSGSKTTSYGAERENGNTYYAWPSWVPRFGIVVSRFPLSVFNLSLKNYEAYDVGRLPFVVDIAAFFRVMDSDVAAKRVSSIDELNSQLLNVLQGAVRRILATNRLETIMQDRSSLGEEFTKEVDDQLKQWGVLTVKTIEFMDIRDALGSTVIENMMAKEQSRIDQESRVTVAENHRIAAEAEIEAQRSVDVQQQEALQQVGIRTAKKDEEVGIAMELSKQKVQQEAAQTAEKQMAVQKVNETRAAEIAQSVTVVDAEAYKQSTTLRAEADLAATQNQAKGIEAKGVAEGKAETAKLMAPVTAQITLADKIGGDDGYQNYLIKVREVEAGEAVGRSMADAIGNGDLKIIANGGSVSEGTSNLGKLFGLDMGTNLTGLITALSQTDEGKALVEKVVGKPKTEPVEQTSL